MKKLYYGAAYYPELWDEETIDRDIELMKEAHINVVRMAEFAWSTLEPHQDRFNVKFFVNIIHKLYQNGISTVICTPTPTPPIWVSHNHPKRMLVDENGVAMVHGGRQQVCTNNEFMRERSALITEKIAEVYGCLPGVIAWQLDNEIKANVAECYCETCKTLWHKWLQKRYGSIDKLNSAWGTRIWSQYYEAFEQVPQPFKTPMGQNPSLATAYRRFSRDLAAEFLKEQADIIRKYSKLPITHNSSLNHFLDNEKAFETLDFASFDHYSTSGEYPKMLSYIDTFKTLKGDKSFWVMETAPSFSASVCGHQAIHNNGYIVAEAAAAYALGAECFSYWLWRQQRTGVEQTHGHVISSWGEPGVGFKNVVAAGKLKEKLETALSQTVPAKAELAVTYSDTARLYFMAEPFETLGFDYVREMMKWQEWILNIGIHRDFIFEHNSFEGYKLLITPYLPHVSDDYRNRAIRFVENGGIWIVGPLTGIRTGEHTVHTDKALGKLEEFSGVKTVFHYPMTGSGAIGKAFGIEAPLSLWSTVFQCIEAKEAGIIDGGVTPGMAFITESNRGKGKIIMLGSMPKGEQGEKLLRKMILHYSNEAGINIPVCTPGTIVVPRNGKSFVQWVVINMDGKGGSLELPFKFTDMFSGEENDGVIKLNPYECKVFGREN